MVVGVTLLVTMVSGLMYITVIGQTTPPLTYVTGPDVCFVNVMFRETRLVTFTQRTVYYSRCNRNRRCTKRYRSQLRLRNVTSDSWRFEPRCCAGFTLSEDRCEKVRADKVQKLDNGTDVKDYSVWPPIIGTLMAVFAISVITVIIVLKRKSSTTRNGDFVQGNNPGESHTVSNHTYADALPSVSHSYETLDASPVTKSHSYEMLDANRVGMTQNIYDSIDTYKILKSGSKK